MKRGVALPPEIHLIVLWPNARKLEKRMLDDIARHVTVLDVREAEWPVRAEDGYARFYCGHLPDVPRKTEEAGRGKFLSIIVRDERPRYGLRTTNRGTEFVNLRLFAMKWRYRGWAPEGLPIHDTLTAEEARRDIMMMTGSTVEDWRNGSAKERPFNVLPGANGWRSMRELFGVLNETTPYLVQRVWEKLPDGFDLDSGDDIDLLAADGIECASILDAAAGEGTRHFTTVAGRRIPFDIRTADDGYYDERWARAMLRDRRQNFAGVYVPSATDAFYSIVYHATFHKRIVAARYEFEKARELAAETGVGGEAYDDWLPALDSFMRERGYTPSKTSKVSGGWNASIAGWTLLAAGARDWCGASNVRPFAVFGRDFRMEGKALCLLSGEWQGHQCVIKCFSMRDKEVAEAEQRALAALRAVDHGAAARPLFWHIGGGYVYSVIERVKGTSLDRLVASGRISSQDASRIAEGCVRLADALTSAGIAHRSIEPARIMVRDDGGVCLTGFGFSVFRSQYRKEAKVLRKRLKQRLVPLGGEFAWSPGLWNDSWSLAACVRQLPSTAETSTAVERLERMARRRDSFLRVKLPGRMKARLAVGLAAGLLSWFFSARKRKSAKLRARMAFAMNSLFDRRPRRTEAEKQQRNNRVRLDCHSKLPQ